MTKTLSLQLKYNLSTTEHNISFSIHMVDLVLGFEMIKGDSPSESMLQVES